MVAAVVRGKNLDWSTIFATELRSTTRQKVICGPYNLSRLLRTNVSVVCFVCSTAPPSTVTREISLIVDTDSSRS